MRRFSIPASRLHLMLTYTWALFAIPTILWWRDSVFVVSLVSLYANAVGHWSAFEAAKAAEESKKTNETGTEPAPETVP